MPTKDEMLTADLAHRGQVYYRDAHNYIGFSNRLNPPAGRDIGVICWREVFTLANPAISAGSIGIANLANADGIVYPNDDVSYFPVLIKSLWAPRRNDYIDDPLESDTGKYAFPSNYAFPAGTGSQNQTSGVDGSFLPWSGYLAPNPPFGWGLNGVIGVYNSIVATTIPGFDGSIFGDYRTQLGTKGILGYADADKVGSLNGVLIPPAIFPRNGIIGDTTFLYSSSFIGDFSVGDIISIGVGIGADRLYTITAISHIGGDFITISPPARVAFPSGTRIAKGSTSDLGIKIREIKNKINQYLTPYPWRIQPNSEKYLCKEDIEDMRRALERFTNWYVRTGVSGAVFHTLQYRGPSGNYIDFVDLIPLPVTRLKLGNYNRGKAVTLADGSPRLYTMIYTLSKDPIASYIGP